MILRVDRIFLLVALVCILPTMHSVADELAEAEKISASENNNHALVAKYPPPETTEKPKESDATETAPDTQNPQAAINSTPESYTVYDAIFAAREHNMQLKAGKEAQSASHTDKYRAFTELAPTVHLNNNLTRYRASDSLLRDNPTLYDPHTRNTAIVITQPIFSGGSTISNIYRTDHLAKAADSNFDALQHSIILNAITAYEALRTARSVHEMNIKNEQALKDYLEMTETRFQHGAVTRTDLMQVESRFASAIASTLRAHNNVVASEAQFEHIIGYHPPNELSPVVVSAIAVPADFDSMLKKAMSDNPELLSAQQSFKAASRGVDGSIARLAPSVSLQAQRNNTDTKKVSPSKTDGDSIALSISVPIFQSGAEYLDIKKSRHYREQARYSMEETRRKIREDAIRAWENYKSANSVVEATKKAVDAAAQAYEFVLIEANAGARTSLNVLDAELELFSSRVQHRQAEAEAVIAVFSVHKVMGDLLATVDK